MKFITNILNFITYTPKMAWNQYKHLALLGLLIIKTYFLDRMMLTLSLPTIHQPLIIFKRTDIKIASLIYQQSNLSIKQYNIFSNVNIIYIYIYKTHTILRMDIYIYIYIWSISCSIIVVIYIYIYIQVVPGGMCQISGECSLC